MARKFKIKGKTTEEKFMFLERYLKHMRRRTNKTVVGIMSPTHIHSYVDHPREDGLVLKFVVPADGKILKGVLSVGSYSVKKQVKFSCRISGPSGSVSKDFKTKKLINAISIDADVKVGDSLEVFVDPVKNDKNIWSIETIQISLLYEISTKDSILKRFAIEELEAELEKSDEGI